MDARDWYAEEQSRRSMDEVRRLWQRGRRRPILIFLICAFICGAFAFKKSRKILQFHTARAVFVVREFASGRGGGDRERPPTVLVMQEHLARVLFNRTTLVEIMQETKVFGKLPDTNPELAVGKFKGSSGFKLEDNGFAEVDGAAGPRSAKLMLTFTHPDPVMASFVVEAMAEKVHDLETKSREQYYDAATALAKNRMETENEALRELESQLTVLRHSDKSARRVGTGEHSSTRSKLQSFLKRLGSTQDIGATEKDAWKVIDALKRRKAAEGLDEILIRGEEANEQVIAIRLQIQATKGRLDEVTHQLAVISISRAEDARSGIHFDLVDSSTVALSQQMSKTQIAIRSILMFFALIPLIGIAIGAFDSNVYSSDDLARLGVRVLGTIPEFHGDRVASLRDRMKTAVAPRQTR